MGDKSYKWRKVSRDLLTDERTLRLSTLALHLRLVLEAMSDVDEGQTVAGSPAPGVGWMLDEYGDAYDLERIAALVRADEADVEAALSELQRARVAVRADSGAWGSVGHEDRQVDPTTKRTRGWRERAANAAGTSGERSGNGPGTSGEHPGTPQRAEGRGQRAEVSPTPDAGAGDPAPARPGPEPLLGARLRHARELVGTFTPATAAQRSGITRGLYAQLEADEVLPTREQLGSIAVALGQPDIATWPLPERDLDLVAGVVRQRRDLGVELGAVDPESPLTPTAHDVAAVYAAEPTDREHGLSLADGWRRVLSRAAEEARREVARGKRWGLEHFTLAELAAAKRRRRLLDAVDLDKRDEPVARGSPGRAPRITAERRYQDKGVPPEKETT